MVRVETSSSVGKTSAVTAGTSASFTRPGHSATAKAPSAIVVPADTLGATDRVEEAGLGLGTAACGGGQLLVLVCRDVARLGWN